jgi:hypothetical protein
MDSANMRVEPSEILLWWQEFIGELPFPGKYLLHRTPEVERLLETTGPDVFATFATPTEAQQLQTRATEQIEELVDAAIVSSTTWNATTWLRHWWLPGADNAELKYAARQALNNPRDTKSTVWLDPSRCPSLAGLLCLRHDTEHLHTGDSHKLRMTHDLLCNAIALAIKEAWYRALLTNTERDQLRKEIRVRWKNQLDNDWIEYHWWTGKGERSP